MSGCAHPCALVDVICIKRWTDAKTDVPGKKELLSKTPKEYTPSPIANVNIGAYGAGIGHKEFMKDAEQAVQQAVAYCLTHDEVYAENAIRILTEWCKTCKSFEGSNAPLELGWGGCSFARCAEILKHVYPKWKSLDIEKVLLHFIDAIVMPKICAKLSWTNNWQTTICEARLQIAILRDDQSDIEWAIKEYKRILSLYVLQTGQTQETLRDLVHAQFGIGSLLQIPELLYVYSQGKINLFESLLAKVCEFHAELLLGKIPVGSGLHKEQIKEPWFLPCGWEIALHHFEKRCTNPIQLPNTTALLGKHRPESYVFHWGLGTLTHYGRNMGPLEPRC